jgi:hypothetical protein
MTVKVELIAVIKAYPGISMPEHNGIVTAKLLDTIIYKRVEGVFVFVPIVERFIVHHHKAT